MEVCQDPTPNSKRLVCTYNDKPLGFEKDMLASANKIQAQDPLKEVDLGDGGIKRPIYISTKTNPSMKDQITGLLK